MKKLTFLLVAFCPLLAAADTTFPPLAIQNGGVTNPPYRFRLNFVNGGCVDNPTTRAKDCTLGGGGTGTVTSIGIGTGLSSTQSPLTTTGTISLATGAAAANLGAAGGDLTGTYPSPTVANGAISNAKLANSSITINTTSPIGGGSSASLGGSVTLTCPTCLTSTTSAGGSLTGTYPNPTIASSVTLTTPVMSGGLTASGSGSYNFSGSTGTFTFPTGGWAGNISISGSPNIGSLSTPLGNVFLTTVKAGSGSAVNLNGQVANTADPIGNASGQIAISAGPTINAIGQSFLNLNGNGNNTNMLVMTGDATFAAVYGRQMTADTSGTTIAKVVVFSSDLKVQTAPATANLTNWAGLALGTRTNGQSVNVGRIGPMLASCDAGVVAGDLVVTSDAVAGNVKTNNTPPVGAMLGRAMEATSHTVSGKCYVDFGAN